MAARRPGETRRAPRPRGGQSVFGPCGVARDGCSPPTRGSVGHLLPHTPRHSVLPAHAGVSRRCLSPHSRGASAPRPRGGQSATSYLTHLATACSPPTRGSVVAACLRIVEEQVLPAHAGVSRCRQAASRSCRCAPRPRGGQSRRGEAGDGTYVCSPPTRGSVDSGPHAAAVESVLPAHAGVSRSAVIELVRGCGAPRPRGGQSERRNRIGSRLRCSPPTRGSVGGGGGPVAVALVLPAHAGVSRGSPARARDRFCAPRPRGGQSRVGSLRRTRARCSPPTRGSVGACATGQASPRVLPAHAGVSRLPERPSRRRSGAPRPRGGQSFAQSLSGKLPQCSPPTRGSVVRAPPTVRVENVLPAHAGVRRIFDGVDQHDLSAPRPRGGQSMVR